MSQTIALVTWNIQNGKGVDGVTDLARIARVAAAMGDADVVCLQEIARGDSLFGGGADQVAELSRLFPGFAPVFGPTLVRGARQYGNLILSRLPVLQTFNHLLPHPAEGGIKHMQRAAVEAVVRTAFGPLRVLTTHLEYYSTRHRNAQIARLRELQEEAAANEAAPAKDAPSPYDGVPRPASLVLCGDFNSVPGDPQYERLFAAPLVDAWTVARKGEPHAPTFCVHESTYGNAPDCRDFFAVTPDVAARIESMQVDVATQASDHQPVRLVLRATP